MVQRIRWHGMTSLAPVEDIRQGVLRAVSQQEPDHAMAWTVWPARERPGRGLAVLGALVAIGLGAAVAWNDLAMGLLSALVVAVALQRFLLPTDHVLTSHAIEVHEPLRVRRVPWSQVHGVIWRGDQGLLQATRDDQGRMLPRSGGPRGLVVMLGADPVAASARRDAVDACLRRHGG
jgi:hypothetical protein